MATRITVARGTPPPTQDQAVRFRALILPQVRTRRWWDTIEAEGFIVTIGDVLDAPPRKSCATRFAWHSSEKQTSGIVLQKFCQKLECSRCVDTYLAGRVGGAWALWNGSASVLLVGDDVSQSVRARLQQEAGVCLAGPGAIPGAVSLGINGGRMIFHPGDELRGDELAEEFVAALRAVELRANARIGGAPRNGYASLPLDLSRDMVRIASDTVGIDLTMNGAAKVFAKNVTDEQHAAWVQLLRQSRR